MGSFDPTLPENTFPKSEQFYFGTILSLLPLLGKISNQDIADECKYRYSILHKKNTDASRLWNIVNESQNAFRQQKNQADYYCFLTGLHPGLGSLEQYFLICLLRTHKNNQILFLNDNITSQISLSPSLKITYSDKRI